jgi:hypothetical protein
MDALDYLNSDENNADSFLSGQDNSAEGFLFSEDIENPDAGLGVIGRVAKAGRQAYQAIGKGAGNIEIGIASQIENQPKMPPPYMTPRMYEDWKKSSPEQYEAVKKGERIGKNPLSDVLYQASEVYPDIEKGRPLGIFSDAINGFMEFAPAMALTAVAPGVGTMATFESIAGSKYDQYIEEGKDPETAYNASVLSASLTTPVEMAGNLIQLKTLGKLLQPFATKTKLSKPFQQYISAIFKNAAAEGIEELTQQELDVIADTYANNPDAEPLDLANKIGSEYLKWETHKEALQAGGIGALGGAIIPAVGGGVRYASDRVQGEDILEIKARIREKEEEKTRQGKVGTLTKEEVNQIVKDVRSNRNKGLPIDILKDEKPADTFNANLTKETDIQVQQPIDILKDVTVTLTREQQIRSDMEVRGTVPGQSPIAGISAEESARTLEEGLPYIESVEQQYRQTPRGQELLRQDLANQDPYLQDLAFRIITGENLDLRGIDPQDLRSLSYIVGEDVLNAPRQGELKPVPVREGRGLVIPQQSDTGRGRTPIAGLLPEEQKKLPAPEPGIIAPPPSDIGPEGEGQFAPTRRGPVSSGTGPAIEMGVLSKGDNPKDYTGNELRQIAKDNGLKMPKSILKKSDMIDFIKEGIQENAKRIRENEGQIYEGRNVQEISSEESGQDLEQRSSEQPGRQRKEITPMKVQRSSEEAGDMTQYEVIEGPNKGSSVTRGTLKQSPDKYSIDETLMPSVAKKAEAGASDQLIKDLERLKGKSTPEVTPEPVKEEFKPIKNNTIEGLKVRKEVPNIESIASTLDNYEIMEGVREIPIDEWYPEDTFYDKKDIERSEKLANEIKKSGEINPLIIVTEEGQEPYILEGLHRLVALHKLGKKSFPAIVVSDRGKTEPVKEVEKPVVDTGTNAGEVNLNKIAHTDKSVRDNSQRASYHSGVIRVENRSGRKKVGQFNVSMEEWEQTEKGPSANPNYNKKKLVEAKHKKAFPNNLEDGIFPPLVDRIIDSEIRAIDKVYKDAKAATPTKEEVKKEPSQPNQEVKAEKIVTSEKNDQQIIKADLTKNQDKKLSLKDQKTYLIAEINKAVEIAPNGPLTSKNMNSIQAYADEMGIDAQRLLNDGEDNTGAPTWVKIDIPGDGVFTIVNNKKALLEFKKNAKQLSTTYKNRITDDSGSPTIEQDAEKAIILYGGKDKAYNTIKRQVEQVEFTERELKRYNKLLEYLKPEETEAETPKPAPQSTQEETKPNAPGMVRLDKGGVKPFVSMREFKSGKNKTSVTGKVEVTFPDGKKKVVNKDQIRSMPEVNKPAFMKEGSKFKVKPPKRLYRGTKEGKGTGIYSMGQGIYSTPDKNFAKMYGEVEELNPEDVYPRNPLVLQAYGGAPQALIDWILKNSEYKNIREFNKEYPDPGIFVREKGYDGILAGDEVVYYPEKDASFLRSDSSSIQAPKGKSILSTNGVNNIVNRVKKAFPNIGNINVIQSQAEIPDSIFESAGQERTNDKIFAYYDSQTDSITIVAENMKGEASIVDTLIHEGIGHRGVDAVLTKENRRKLFDMVAKDYRDSEIGKNIIWTYKLDPDLKSAEDQTTFAREVIAHMAVNEPKATLLDRIISFIKQALRSAGIKLRLTDAEIRNVLRRSAEFAQIKSVENRGTFDKTDPRISFSKEKALDDLSKNPHGEFTKESKLAKRTEADTIEAKLSEDFGDLAEYKTKEGFMKDQAEKAEALINSDYEKAKRIAMGEESPSGNLRVAPVYEAVKLRALNEGDSDLLYDLGTESRVPTQLSEYGQEIKAADSSIMEDPVNAMQDVEKDRKEKNKKRGKKVVSIEKVRELKKKLSDAEKKLKEYETKTDNENAGTSVDKLIKKSPKRLYKKTNSKVLKEKIQTSIDQGKEYSDVSTDIQELAKYFITQGVTERNALVREVHNVIKDIVQGITLRETMDAISGYGKFKPLSKDEVLVKLRGLKGQMQQVAKLEDMQRGMAPLKTGIERRTPTDEERRLIKKVEEMKKELGIETVDPEKQLKSALDSVKTRLQNQIKDLEYQIETGQKILKKKTGLKYDVEAEKLRKRRDDLKKQFDELFGKTEMTEEQRIKVAVNAVNKSIEEYTRRINENDLTPKPKRTPTQSEELTRLRAQRDELKAKVKELRDLAKPKKRPEEVALQRLKTRLNNEIKKFGDKLENLDLQKDTRKETMLDAEGRKLKAERDTIKQAFNAAVENAGVVTREEADRLIELSQEMARSRQEMESGGDRFKYGAAKVAFLRYIDHLKGVDRTIKTMLKDEWQEVKTVWKDNKAQAFTKSTMDIIRTISDLSISMMASLDNSFLGRQGLNTLLTHPTVWGPAAKKSFVDIYKTLASKHGGNIVRDAVMADAYSRPNFINGDYDTAKLIPKSEEQFPTSIPERIPYLGRAFKASENAFLNSGVRMRINTYDMLKKIADMQGVDTSSKEWVQETGKLINSVTARGDLGKMGSGGPLRLIFWAPKMLWGNINVLTAHFGGAGLKTPFARQQARRNLVKIVGLTALVAAIIDGLGELFGNKDTVEWDPRSSDFMKVKIGNTRFDMTGGKGSIITLLARAATFKTKSTKTQKVTDLNSGRYGSKTLFDVIVDFMVNKSAPVTKTAIDITRGRNFNYEKPTIGNTSYNLATPIGVQNFVETYQRSKGDIEKVPVEEIVGDFLDIVGINTATYDSNAVMRKKYRELRKNK